MTVTVRPFPKRTYQNGIRPFRPVVPANNIRPYTLKTWRPPVPEPLAPAPLLGPKELLGLGVLVLAQLWGRLASRPSTTAPVVPPAGLSVTGTMPPAGNTTGATLLIRTTPGTWVYATSANCATSTSSTGGTGNWGFTADVVSVWLEYPPGPCGPLEVEVWALISGNPAPAKISSRYSAYPHGSLSLGRGLEFQWNGPGAVPFSAGTVPIPLPDGFTTPEVVQEPATLPKPLVPLPVMPEAPPTTVPGGPEPLPLTVPEVVPTTPGPAAPPATAPQVPRRTVPLPLPGATPTKDGVIVPQAPAPVAVTPPDAHFPVPGAPPVTGNGPRPTPEGIAQELGRLEQKLAKMLNPGPDGPGDGTDRQQLLEQRMRQVWEFLTSITAGGGYGLSSPCELDDNGERIVTTVEYGGGFNSLDVLSNKIDALAALLQAHKDLKQPICKQTPAVGQPVTVDFLQVD